MLALSRRRQNTRRWRNSRVLPEWGDKNFYLKCNYIFSWLNCIISSYICMSFIKVVCSVANVHLDTRVGFVSLIRSLTRFRKIGFFTRALPSKRKHKQITGVNYRNKNSKASASADARNGEYLISLRLSFASLCCCCLLSLCKRKQAQRNVSAISRNFGRLNTSVRR